MFMSLPHYVLTNQSQLKRMILDTTEYSSCQLFMFPKLFKKPIPTFSFLTKWLRITIQIKYNVACGIVYKSCDVLFSFHFKFT